MVLPQRQWRYGNRMGDSNGKWSYFEKSGAMVADRAVPASDGESYVIGKDGYLANRKDAGIQSFMILSNLEMGKNIC